MSNNVDAYTPSNSESDRPAVKWRLFQQAVGEVREAFASVPADELDSMIGEAVKGVRKDRHRERHTRK